MKATDKFPDSLTLINLGGSNVAEIATTAFSSLSSLETLFLSQHNLKAISHVTLPSSLLTLAADTGSITSISAPFHFTDSTSNSLEHIGLPYNPIQNISSNAFSKLHNLKTLDLGSTKVTNLDHVSFPPSLTNLVLSETKLTNIPKSLTSLTKLETLYLFEVDGLACSCDDKALAQWYHKRMNSPLDIDLHGSCMFNGTGTDITDFLGNFHKHCPSLYY